MSASRCRIPLARFGEGEYVPVLSMLGLCAAWILFTLVGHDPWKPDEAYSFGLVLDFLSRGDWVVPTLAGEPFLEKPPLFFITAGFFVRAFDGWLAPHDAARLASGLYIAIAVAFLALAARELHHGRHGWTSVLTMLGCLGLVVRAHQLITDVALVAGIAMGTFGLASSRRSPVRGGIALGAGVAVAFLAKGLLGPGMLGLAALALPLFPAWRHVAYARALGIAALVALPGVAGWTIALYLRSPDLFDTWLVTNNFGRFLGFTDIGPHQPRFFYAYTILWYGFPAFPLAAHAVWAACRHRPDRWADPAFQVPTVMLVAMASVLGMAADARELYLMPVLVPLALLATAGVDRLPPVAASALARLGKVSFGLLALGLWLGWAAQLTGTPELVVQVLSDLQPGFAAHFSATAFALAALATLAWILLTRPRVADAPCAIAQWTAGIALCLALVGTLWLPYLDAGKSYREMILSLLDSVPDKRCVASRDLGEPQRALLYYYGHLVTVRQEVAHTVTCDVLLVQGWRKSGAPARERGWTPVWEGARAGDTAELYRLYVRSRFDGSRASNDAPAPNLVGPSVRVRSEGG